MMSNNSSGVSVMVVADVNSDSDYMLESLEYFLLQVSLGAFSSGEHERIAKVYYYADVSHAAVIGEAVKNFSLVSGEDIALIDVSTVKAIKLSNGFGLNRLATVMETETNILLIIPSHDMGAEGGSAGSMSLRFDMDSSANDRVDQALRNFVFLQDMNALSVTDTGQAVDVSALLMHPVGEDSMVLTSDAEVTYIRNVSVVEISELDDAQKDNLRSALGLDEAMQLGQKLTGTKNG